MNKNKSKYIFLNFLIGFFICAVSFAQNTDTQDYLIKVSSDFCEHYALLPESQKGLFANNYFEKSDVGRIEPLFKRNNSALDHWFRITASDKIKNELTDFKNRGKIIEFQENNRLKIQALPNDSLLNKQWYFKKIRAFESWANFSQIEKIILAVIDTGIDYQHPDLQGSLWINSAEDLNNNSILDSTDIDHLDNDGNGYIDDVIGWDFTDAPRFPDGGDFLDPDNDPMDEFQSGHGTQIAGIISAHANNDRGIAGIVPQLEVMNLRAGTASGYLEEDDVAQAVVYAIENGARVINMSFGDVVVSLFLKDVISYAWNNGIVIVCSSGNSGTNEMHFPSGFAETISVGATDSLDNVTGFSTWGQTLDLVAPGENIISCTIGGGYNYSNGTSFSAPMVSAAAGFVLSCHPEMNNEQVRNILKSTAKDVGTNGWDPYFGSGRLDLYNTSIVTDESTLFIHSPLSGSYTAENLLPVVVTIQDADLIEAFLWVGESENPSEWSNIVSGINHQVINDTIAIVDVSNYSNESLVLKLQIKTWQGTTKEYRSILHIDKTAPEMTSAEKLKMFDENRYAILISFETDDITTGEIYFRGKNSSSPFNAKSLQYETKQHRVKLTSTEIAGDIEYYIQVENLAGLEKKGTVDYFNLSPFVIPILPFPPISQSFPSGHVLSKIADFDSDGNDEVVLSLYDENNSFGNTAIFEYESDQFVKKYETEFRAIPRDFGDADSDGKPDLLMGFGKFAFLVEANNSNQFPQNITWFDSSEFWVSRIADLDNDGINEIIGKRGIDYIGLENNGDNSFIEKFQMQNTTLGSNALGPPTTIVGDFDNDTYPDLVFGDYDGDILVFENNGNDIFENRLQMRLPLPDATDYMVAGNIFGNGNSSFFAGTHTDNSFNYEHEFDARYWSFFHITSENNNNYKIQQRINIFGYSDVRDFDSGISYGLDSLNNKSYVFMTVHPDLYVFESNGDSLTPKWYLNGVQSNKVVFHDFNKNGASELFVNNGVSFVGFEIGEGNQPQIPADFSAVPLDTTTILLKWQPIIGAQKYIIYRGLENEYISVYDSVNAQTTYIDSDVVNNQVYHYAVKSFDNSYQIPYSALTPVQTARPNEPPLVDTLIVLNRNQIQVYFNEMMLKSSFSPGNFKVSGNDKYATSAIALKNGLGVLVTFQDNFSTETEDTLEISNLVDIDKTALNYSGCHLPFYFNEIETTPYISDWKLEDRYHLIIAFNLPMDTETVYNLKNYTLDPQGEITNVEAFDNYDLSFRLTISRNSFLGASGITTYLTLNNIKSASGIEFSDGNKFSITMQKKNLKDLIVYPQPVTMNSEVVTFANITENTEIYIYDIHGHFIIKLKETDKNGGISWNIRNESGQAIAAGIYIYYAKNANESKTGKIAIIR